MPSFITIKRCKLSTLDPDFEEKNLPVVIEDLTDGWRAHQAWRLSALRSQYGEKSFDIGTSDYQYETLNQFIDTYILQPSNKSSVKPPQSLSNSSQSQPSSNTNNPPSSSSLSSPSDLKTPNDRSSSDTQTAELAQTQKTHAHSLYIFDSEFGEKYPGLLDDFEVTLITLITPSLVCIYRYIYFNSFFLFLFLSLSRTYIDVG